MDICVVEFFTSRDAKAVIIAFVVLVELIVDSSCALSITAALKIAGVGGIAEAADIDIFRFGGRGGG